MQWIPELESIRTSDLRGLELRTAAMEALSKLDGFDWCGIYALRGELLELETFVGAPTDHTKIPVGRGVCGSAVSENTDKIVADVRAEENYLACSLETRSEIVVLIRHHDGSILGQIDIDSHKIDRFKDHEHGFLKQLAEFLASRWI